MNQGIDLERLSEEYNKYKSNYDRLKDFVDKECFRLQSLITMYRIARFLSHPLHKRYMYTVSQISHDAEIYSYEEVEEALYLSKYKIFPVRHSHQDGKDYFCFDKKYLR